MRAERGNPVVVQPVMGWEADREEGLIPRREQDDQEANAGGRKAAGNRREGRSLQPVAMDNWPDIGPGARPRKRADVVR